MMRMILSIAAGLMLLGALSHARAADDSTQNHIIALERGALERWGKGDPQGFLDIINNCPYLLPNAGEGWHASERVLCARVPGAVVDTLLAPLYSLRQLKIDYER